MDMIAGRALYKGWKTVPFKPGKFYDVHVSISEGKLTVSAPKPSSAGKKCASMSYKDMSDFYYDWVFTFPMDREEYPEIPIVHQATNYIWTKSCANLVEAYVKAVKAVNTAINQSDELFHATELTYLYRTRDVLREIKPHISKVITKPMPLKT